MKVGKGKRRAAKQLLVCVSLLLNPVNNRYRCNGLLRDNESKASNANMKGGGYVVSNG